MGVIMAESLYGGQVTLYSPTPKRPYYRCLYHDTTGTKRFKNVGKTRADALAGAAALVGVATPAHTLHVDAAPTVAEAFAAWMQTRMSKVSSRTYAYDEATIRRSSGTLHDVRINRLSPEMLRQIDTSGRSREVQKKIRSLWRQTLHMHKAWLRHTPEALVEGIHVDGSRRDDDRTQVDPRVIPSTTYVNALLARAWSTENPLVPQSDDTFTHASDRDFGGLPETMIVSQMRATQKHYTDPTSFQQGERARVGRTYQTLALINALSAGALLRWGEISALRLHHIMDDHAIRTVIRHGTDYDTINETFSGHIRVMEQASCDVRGKMTVSKPKMARQRQTTLPSFLPSVDRQRRLHAPAPHEVRTFSQAEALAYWMENQTPALRMMLVTHLQRIFSQWSRRELGQSVETVGNTLIFPTSTRARSTPIITDGLRGHHRPCTLTGGGYRSNGNFRTLMTPVYDHISDTLDEYPYGNPEGKTRRSGYTIHGLRHYGISLQIKAGRSIVDVSADAGHRTAGFTLQRYSHLIRDAHEVWEF